MAATTISATPTHSLADEFCIGRLGAKELSRSVYFRLWLRLLPIGACVCTKMGPQPSMPARRAFKASYSREDANYGGLCSSAVNYGHCPTGVCDTVEVREHPTVSPFVPDTCISALERLFRRSLQLQCGYGFCPIHTATEPVSVIS